MGASVMASSLAPLLLICFQCPAFLNCVTFNLLLAKPFFSFLIYAFFLPCSPVPLVTPSVSLMLATQGREGEPFPFFPALPLLDAHGVNTLNRGW